METHSAVRFRNWMLILVAFAVQLATLLTQPFADEGMKVAVMAKWYREQRRIDTPSHQERWAAILVDGGRKGRKSGGKAMAATFVGARRAAELM